MAVSFAKAPVANRGASGGPFRGKGGGGMAVSFEGLEEAAAKLDALRQMVLARWDVAITSDSPYIGFVTEGTAAHEIRPRGARALYWPGAMHPVMRVWHPGTRPNPFIEDAYQARKGELEQRAVSLLEQGVNDANPRAADQAAQLAANVLLGELRARAPRDTGALAGSLRTQFHVGRA